MGREVRRVPGTWEHPKDGSGGYIPLLGRTFSEDLLHWEEGARQWERGLVRYLPHEGWKQKPVDVKSRTYEEWAGPRPEAKDYMPEWPESERTHFQMYEVTTEGTPISPVLDRPEALARWLTDNGASAFGPLTATYEQWLGMIRQGWAPSAMAEEGKGLRSGVDVVSEMRETDRP